MSGSESLHVVFGLYINVLPLEIQLSSEDSWDSNCLFNAATFVSPVHCQDLDLQRHMSCSVS